MTHPAFSAAITAQSADDIVTETLTDMAEQGCTVSGWDDVAPQRALVELHARAEAKEQELRVQVVNAGFIDRAELAGDSFLDQALTWFGLERIAATRALWQLAITCPASAGPYTLSPTSRTLIVAADDGTLFEDADTQSRTIASGATTLVFFECRSVGTIGNQLAGTISRVVAHNSMPGLSVSNLASAGAGQTVAARDAETNANAVIRAKGRWGTLSSVLTAAGWASYILTSVPTITRISVDDASSVGAVILYCANAVGPSAAEDVALADEAAQAVRAAGTGTVTVLEAEAREEVFSVLLKTDGTNPLASAQAATAIVSLAADIPIGGTLYLASLYAVLMAIDGVVNVPSLGLGTDLVLASNEVLTLTPTVTQQ